MKIIHDTARKGSGTIFVKFSMTNRFSLKYKKTQLVIFSSRILRTGVNLIDIFQLHVCSC